MSILEAVIIAAVAAGGFLLWAGVREQNKRTRPNRVRQALIDRGLSPDYVDRVLEAREKGVLP